MGKSNYYEIWKSLEIDSKKGESYEIIKRLILVDGLPGIYIGINIPRKTKFFAAEATNASLRKISSLPQFEGFQIEKKIFKHEQRNNYTIMLQAAASQFNDVFTYLIDDIMISIDHFMNEDNIMNLIIEKVQKWQKFLDQCGSEGLSSQERKGLYGELWLLKYHVMPEVGHERSIQSWTGPERTFHDFQFKKCSVEVKTSSSKQHHKIHIANERQLDDNNVQKLYLSFIELDILKQQGESLNQLIDSVREEIQGYPILLEQFHQMLFKAGYIDYQRELYEGELFKVRKVSYYEVKAGFPRIVSSDLKEGVGDVNYSVMVSACSDYRVEKDVALHGMRGE